MKQVGFRQEAARLEELVPVDELCCSTWLTDFRSKHISSSLPTVIIESTKKGQCGKLKCCLNYELDTYMDALKGFLILKPN
jgi:cell fate regulator YaaT (PSP1 superfamily)